MTFRRAVRTLFDLSTPVSRGTYAALGVSLAILKYAVDTAVVYAATGQFQSPLFYLLPVTTFWGPLRSMEPALLFLLVLWTMPFLWIGLALTLRRTKDADLSPWMSFVYFVPVANYLFMLLFCLMPSRPQPQRAHDRPFTNDDLARPAILGALGAVLVSLAMLGFGVYVLRGYGTALFLGTPAVIGAVNAYFLNRRQRRTIGATVLVVVLSLCMAGCSLLLFALEGAVCLAMAAPLVLVAGILGAFVGYAIADGVRTPPYQVACVVGALPLVALLETALASSPRREVVSAIEVDAPPERVWSHVVEFSELPAATELVFRAGVASPERARIEGSGVGAVRRCEFSTGTFVEPITRWQPPSRLSFDVLDQPVPMIEWSPYGSIHPPHLDGSFRAVAGEFRLVPLEGGRTRLEGSTWYELDLAPRDYWGIWAETIVHRIHLRVLRHIKRLAEEGANAAR
jgi:hypothetical protein